jgi:hypothetical protein
MKTMKLIYPLAFALAITLAIHGLPHHKPVDLSRRYSTGTGRHGRRHARWWR